MWQDLQAMLSGPGHLRFIIQPLAAILLGLPAARRDVEVGQLPFLLSLRESKNRGQVAALALKQIAIPLAVATVLDAVLQYIVLGQVKALAPFIVGPVLIALPYSASRGLGNRALSGDCGPDALDSATTSSFAGGRRHRATDVRKPV
jgi:hypothetical protein